MANFSRGACLVPSLLKIWTLNCASVRHFRGKAPEVARSLKQRLEGIIENGFLISFGYRTYQIVILIQK